MSDRIKLDVPTGYRYPSTVPFEGDALLISEERTAQGGDTVTFSLKLPEGFGPVRVAVVLVKLDD